MKRLNKHVPPSVNHSPPAFGSSGQLVPKVSPRARGGFSFVKTYRINDWDKHYETAETRKLVNLRWLPVPNKHDGLGFRRIAAQPDAAELFTAWILMLQVASKGRGPDERGNLLRGQEALGDEDLAMMTGFPKAIFTRALRFFSDPKQGWLSVTGNEDAQSPVITGESPAIPASSPAVWNGREGKEGHGMEGKKQVASLPFESPEFAAAWSDFDQHRRELKKKLTPTATKQIFADLAAWGEQRAIAAIRYTIGKGWQGIREPEGNAGRNAPTGKSEFAHLF